MAKSSASFSFWVDSDKEVKRVIEGAIRLIKMVIYFTPWKFLLPKFFPAKISFSKNQKKKNLMQKIIKHLIYEKERERKISKLPFHLACVIYCWRVRHTAASSRKNKRWWILHIHEKKYPCEIMIHNHDSATLWFNIINIIKWLLFFCVSLEGKSFNELSRRNVHNCLLFFSPTRQSFLLFFRI